ncbi:MAG: polysaccharide deacetylase family protein [Actinomycetota bacterium]|nr:polysaccharide deacetylase family protein [Actinomycetota bacterium]
MLGAWLLLAAGILGLITLKTAGAQHRHPNLRLEAPLSTHLASTEAAAWRAFPNYTDAVPVLCYHGVGALPASSQLNVSRTLFAQTMLALHIGGFHTLTLRQYVAWYSAWRSGGSYHLPTKPILLTFDDGRSDSYRAVDMTLRRYKFHAVEFVVPGWVRAHPAWELQWTTMRSMDSSGVWTVQEHFGYGKETVSYRRYGTRGGRFGYLSWLGGLRRGHLESLRLFLKDFHANMDWGVAQLRTHLPDYRVLAMAMPASDQGQTTNTATIEPHVVSWLDAHYPVVFTGDYLYGGPTGTVLPYRLSKQLVFRLAMKSQLSVPTLLCRLKDYAAGAPPSKEYQCPGLESRHRGQRRTPQTISTTKTVNPTAPIAPPAAMRRHGTRADTVANVPQAQE